MSRLSSRGREWAGVPGEPGAGRGGRGQDMGGWTLRGQEVNPVIKHKDDLLLQALHLRIHVAPGDHGRDRAEKMTFYKYI